MRGPAADRVATFASLVDKVPFQIVTELIRKQFFKTESKKVDEIIERLSSKTELNAKNVKFIDVNFALRVLLEMFALEKRVFLKRLENMFNDAKFKDTDPIANSVPFSKFGPIILANFKSLTVLEVAALYRLAWNLGKGRCTFASTCAAINLKGFFMRNIKVYSPQISDLPELSEYRGKDSLNRVGNEFTSLKSERQRETYAQLYKNLEARFVTFGETHQVKIRKLKEMVQVYAEPHAKQEIESIPLNLDVRNTAQSDPTNFDDPLGHLAEVMSHVLTYIRVVRSVQMVSTADTDHGFKQTLLISNALLRSFDSLLKTIEPAGLKFEGVLDAAARKIQHKAIQRIFSRRKQTATPLN